MPTVLLRKSWVNLPSSVVISQAFPGARLVKAFNSLTAETLAEDPNVKGGRRVLFLSSDEESAAGEVAALIEQLGFAPVQLGKLAEGGLLVQARGKSWAQLIFSGFRQVQVKQFAAARFVRSPLKGEHHAYD
jgi:predicted dinucleotide-binding enzyme